MPTYDLSFRIDPLPTWDGYTKRREGKRLTESDFLRSVYRELGLKLYSVAWTDTELTTEMAQKILDLVERLEAEGQAKLGSGCLLEKATPEDEEAAEWFVVRDSPIFQDGETDSWKVLIPSCKACRIARGVHVIEDNMVSERFKMVVETEGFSGIEFLWVEDKGRYQAMQWYLAVATQPLLNPVDHPWYDATRDISLKKDPFNSRERVDPATIRSDWTTGCKIKDAVIEKFPKQTLGFSVHGLMRFLRCGLLDTDFAFVQGTNQLAFRRHVRDKLLEKGLLIGEVYTSPILILDELPAGQREVPEVPGGPQPRVPLDQLADLKRQQEEKYKLFLEKELPVRKASLKASLSLLRKAKRAHPEDYVTGAGPQRLKPFLETLPHPLPESWCKVLGITNGGMITFSDDDVDICEPVPIQELAKCHADLEREAMKADDDFPQGYLFVASVGNGDYYALDRREAGKDDKDCPIALYDHEENRYSQSWDSVAMFLDEKLG